MQYLLPVSLKPWTALAQRIRLIKVPQAYRADSLACSFTHYFRPEDGDYGMTILGMVAANNDPTNAPYKFSVRCAAKDDKECKTGKGGKAQR